MSRPSYVQGADLADLTVTWYDAAGELIDFATGWTFTAKIGAPGADADLDKTSGITGAATAPNVTVVWALHELDDLAPGIYTVQIEATRTSDSKQRIEQAEIEILPAVLPAAP